MKDLHAQSLLPFVPSETDYEASRRLFVDLGFEEVWEDNGYAAFRNGGAAFILQRFDDQHFADNVMVGLNVDNLERWWHTVSLNGLDRMYRGMMPNTSMQRSALLAAADAKRYANAKWSMNREALP